MTNQKLLSLIATLTFKPCTEFDPKTRTSRKGFISDSDDFTVLIYDNEVSYLTDTEQFTASLA